MAALSSIASAAAIGLHTNRYGGHYEQGKSYSADKKLEVATVIARLSSEFGVDPTNSAVSREAKVGPAFVRKVKEELKENQRVLHPDEISQARLKGVGVLAVTEVDEEYLLFLRFTDNTRSNQSYVEELFFHTGTLVSESFISDWFANRFDHSGKFKVGCLVPLDKYKEENIARYFEYCQFIQAINDPSRLKFGDEKHLDGADLYKRKVRPNPVTGEVDGILVEGGFRDRFNINAIMGLDPNKPPLFVSIEEDTNDAASYMAFVILALLSGYFNPWDIFVIDNWTGHLNAEAAMLEDLLWNYVGPDGLPMRILVVYLPTRSPELNPIELVFQILVQRLKKECLLGVRAYSALARDFAYKVFGEMTHLDMLKVTCHCYPNL